MAMSTGNTLKNAGRFLLVTAAVLIGLFIVVSIGLFFVGNVSTNTLERVNNLTASLGFYLQFARWALYLALCLFWQPVMRFLGRLAHWEPYVIDRALANRKTTLVVLILVELLVIQNVLATLIANWR